MRKDKWIRAINGDFTGMISRGVVRCAREVAVASDEFAGEGHPLSRNLPPEQIAPQAPSGFGLEHVPVRAVPGFKTPRLSRFRLQFQLAGQVRDGLVRFCNLASVALRHHIVCIRDLHPLVGPEGYGWGFRLVHGIVQRLPGRNVKALSLLGLVTCFPGNGWKIRIFMETDIPAEQSCKS